MTLNKWTLALASAGVVSLASVAQAEEKTTMSASALTPTTISGYVDTSAQWNPGTGNINVPNYRFGGSGKADGFNLNVVQIRIENPLDESEWAAGYRVDLWAGPDANALNTQSSGFGSGSDFGIRQAYVAVRTPVGNGIDWKMGVFDSILGYESVESPSNPNFTRSWGHSIEPLSHTGLLASYRFSDLISASAGVANSVMPTINSRSYYNDAESYKTYMASIALTAPETMGFLAGSTLYGGVVNGGLGGNAPIPDAGITSWYAGATLATPVTGLRVGAALDVLDIRDTSGETWSVAGYASYQATEKLSFHGRGEYFKNRGTQGAGVNALLFGGTTPPETLSLTGTIQYDLWKNVLSRLEVRWDHALEGSGTWGGHQVGSDGDLKNAVMVAANLVYKF